MNKYSYSILVVDDDQLMLEFISEILTQNHITHNCVSSGKEAIHRLTNHTFDVILIDLKLPDILGLEVLKTAKSIYPNIIAVIITAFGNIENAVEAMLAGAFNYLLKPISTDTIEVLLESVQVHYKEQHTHITNVAPDKKQTLAINTNKVFCSPEMIELITYVHKVADSNSNILITGESGTGKEVVASIVHDASKRKKSAFVKVNCAAIPDNLLESEFFGHEKGAFTGAIKCRQGRFEIAHMGSILLDEISEISLPLQAKLLRVIQEKQFERLGSSVPIKTDVRIIATSNKNLKECIRLGTFREDLFYRLNVIPIHIPPLRERKEDIEPLSKHFINTFCATNNKPIKQLSTEAISTLEQYEWLGNVRELSNFIERLVILSEHDTISKEFVSQELNKHVDIDTKSVNLNIENQNSSLKSGEFNMLMDTLKTCGYDLSKTVQQLAVSAESLMLKLYENNICPPKQLPEESIYKKKPSQKPPSIIC